MAFEFLIANEDESVALKIWPGLEERLWTPAKNKDGSWSFRSDVVSLNCYLRYIFTKLFLESSHDFSMYPR